MSSCVVSSINHRSTTRTLSMTSLNSWLNSYLNTTVSSLLEILIVISAALVPILFDIPIQCHVKLCASPNSSSPALFSSSFIDFWNLEDHFKPSICLNSLDTKELASHFYSLCWQTLDLITPLKIQRTEPAPEPWLNDVTRTARRECRRVKCRWKKDRLHVSFEIYLDFKFRASGAIRGL